MSHSLFRGLLIILVLSAVLVHTQITNLRTQPPQGQNNRNPPTGQRPSTPPTNAPDNTSFNNRTTPPQFLDNANYTAQNHSFGNDSWVGVFHN